MAIGLYVPTDPGAPDEASGKGMISVSFGKLFEKVRYGCTAAETRGEADRNNRVSRWPQVSAMSSNTIDT